MNYKYYQMIKYVFILLTISSISQAFECSKLDDQFYQLKCSDGVYKNVVRINIYDEGDTLIYYKSNERTLRIENRNRQIVYSYVLTGQGNRLGWDIPNITEKKKMDLLISD